MNNHLHSARFPKPSHSTGKDGLPRTHSISIKLSGNNPSSFFALGVEGGCIQEMGLSPREQVREAYGVGLGPKVACACV